MFRIFVFLFLISPAGFSMTVEDPENKAATLRNLFPLTSETQFTCDIPFTFSQTVSRCNFLCEGSFCRENCQSPIKSTFQVQAELCSADHVEIISSLGWSAFSKQKTDLKYGQTWIEEFLFSTDFFIVPGGVFEIQFVGPGRKMIWVDENGEEHSLSTVVIFLAYKQTPDSSGVSFDLILDPDKRGIEQILYFGRPSRDEFFIKKWGLLQ